MTNTITTGAVHHIALTVSDVTRSAEFYTKLLGFQKLMDLGPRILIGNGSLIVGLVSEVSTVFFSSQLKYVWALGVLIVILLVRPQGLLGQKERIG